MDQSGGGNNIGDGLPSHEEMVDQLMAGFERFPDPPSDLDDVDNEVMDQENLEVTPQALRAVNRQQDPNALRAALRPLSTNVLQGSVFRASNLLSAATPGRRQPDVRPPPFPLAGLVSPAARNAAAATGNESVMFRFTASRLDLPVRNLLSRFNAVGSRARSRSALLAPNRHIFPLLGRDGQFETEPPQSIAGTNGHLLSLPGAHRRAMGLEDQPQPMETDEAAEPRTGQAEAGQPARPDAAVELHARLAARATDVADPSQMSDSALMMMLLTQQLQQQQDQNARTDTMVQALHETVQALAQPRPGRPQAGKPPKVWEGKLAYSGRAFLMCVATWFAATKVGPDSWVATTISLMSPQMQQWLAAVCLAAVPPRDPLSLDWQTLSYLVKYGRSNSAPHLVARDRMQEVPILRGRMQEWADELLVLREDCNTEDSSMSDLDFVYHIRRTVRLQRPEFTDALKRAPDGTKWQDPAALLSHLVDLDQDGDLVPVGQKRRRDDDDDDRQPPRERRQRRRTRGRGGRQSRGSRGSGRQSRSRSRSRSPSGKPKFQGHCDWCHIKGHKEYQCKGKKAGKPRASGPTPGASGSGSGSGSGAPKYDGKGKGVDRRYHK